MTAAYRSDPLWLKLEAMTLDEPGIPVPFSQRLSLEAGWTAEETAEAILAYRRFLYLMTTSGKRFSVPSRVETVWQLHLIYTRHYRRVLCGEVLGFMLHHEPGDGTADAPRQAYHAMFGEDIPPRVMATKEFTSRDADWHHPAQSGLLYMCAAVLGIILYETELAKVGPIAVAIWTVLTLVLSPLAFAVIDRALVKHIAQLDLPLFARTGGSRTTTVIDTEAPGSAGVNWPDVEAFVMDLAPQAVHALDERHQPLREVEALARMRTAGEYARFIYLLRTTGEPLTPPQSVDDEWHAHLLSTRSYWDDFCTQRLGGDVHHEPGTGRAGEMRRNYIQYCRAWNAYRQVFGVWPPRSHWPYPTHPNVRRIAFTAMSSFTIVWMASLYFGDDALLTGLPVALAASAATGFITYLKSRDDADYYRSCLVERSDRSRPSSCG